MIAAAGLQTPAAALFCALAFSSTIRFAADPPSSQSGTKLGTIPEFHPELGLGALQGYLDPKALPNSLALIPPPPAPGSAAFADMQEEELGTFYLTDFLARQFESIIVAGLGLDRHPELMPMYFGNYRRLVYLAQTDDPELTARAHAAADRLGLAFERRATGFGDLATSIQHAVGGAA
jgi:hypothetical protein